MRKRFIFIVMALIAVCFFASTTMASMTLTCPSTISKYYDRLGNAYTPNSLHQVTLTDTTYLADFLNNGCYFSYPAGETCGTATTCTATDITGSLRILNGTATLSGGAATVSSISPYFTSSATYVCVGSDSTNGASMTFTNVSSSSFTIAGTGAHVVNYICIGY